MRGETLANMVKTLTLIPVTPTDLGHALAVSGFAFTVYQAFIYRFEPHQLLCAGRSVSAVPV